MQNPFGEHNYYDSFMRQQRQRELERELQRDIITGGVRTPDLPWLSTSGEGPDPASESGSPQSCHYVETSGSLIEGVQIIIITGSRNRGQPPAAEGDWYSYQLSQTRGGWSHMPSQHDITNWQSSPQQQPIDFKEKAFDFASGMAFSWFKSGFAPITPPVLAGMAAMGVVTSLTSIAYGMAKSSDGHIQNIGDIAMP